MQTSARLLLMLGACLCFVASPAVAQSGRGGGKAGGPPPGQAARTAPGPEQQAGSGKARPAARGPQAARNMAAAQALHKNPELGARLQALLPDGANVADAAAGFGNLGQFVSAVRVSNNLGLPFDGVKHELMAGRSLGQAIQKLRPDMPRQEREREMRRAEIQAKADLAAQGVTER